MGNLVIQPALTYAEKIACGKRIGALRGHKGAAGGWIYSANGRALCQGWGAYFNERCLIPDEIVEAEYLRQLRLRQSADSKRVKLKTAEVSNVKLVPNDKGMPLAALMCEFRGAGYHVMVELHSLNRQGPLYLTRAGRDVKHLDPNSRMSCSIIAAMMVHCQRGKMQEAALAKHDLIAAKLAAHNSSSMRELRTIAAAPRLLDALKGLLSTQPGASPDRCHAIAVAECLVRELEAG